MVPAQWHLRRLLLLLQFVVQRSSHRDWQLRLVQCWSVLPSASSEIVLSLLSCVLFRKLEGCKEPQSLTETRALLIYCSTGHLRNVTGIYKDNANGPLRMSRVHSKRSSLRQLLGTVRITIKWWLMYNPPNNFFGFSMDKTDHVIQNRTMVIRSYNHWSQKKRLDRAIYCFRSNKSEASGAILLGPLSR